MTTRVMAVWALGLWSVALTAQAAAQKCLITRADGTLEVRHIQLERAAEAPEAMQRYLDRERPGSRVETCRDIDRPFPTPAARQADRETRR
ncbi:hypothetical protein [Salinicola aestuarinus]|uniref:hypothetical protein n=1 Tax=Salinicola aestuarinus TaxID=1949082 RepID=UPI0013007FAA|nr:hypothetical protein [Salinicola aestuarinus]